MIWVLDRLRVLENCCTNEIVIVSLTAQSDLVSGNQPGTSKVRERTSDKKGDHTFLNFRFDLNLLYLNFSSGINNSTSLTHSENDGGLTAFQWRRISLRAISEENAMTFAWAEGTCVSSVGTPNMAIIGLGSITVLHKSEKTLKMPSQNGVREEHLQNMWPKEAGSEWHLTQAESTPG